MIWWLMSIFNQLKIHFGCFADFHVMLATKWFVIEMPTSVQRTCFICVSAFIIWFRTYRMMLYCAISDVSQLSWLLLRILSHEHLLLARRHHPFDDHKLGPTEFKLFLQWGSILLSLYLFLDGRPICWSRLLYSHEICQVCPQEIRMQSIVIPLLHASRSAIKVIVHLHQWWEVIDQEQYLFHLISLCRLCALARTIACNGSQCADAVGHIINSKYVGCSLRCTRSRLIIYVIMWIQQRISWSPQWFQLSLLYI